MFNGNRMPLELLFCIKTLVDSLMNINIYIIMYIKNFKLIKDKIGKLFLIYLLPLNE